MKSLYTKLDYKKFKLLSVVICFLADLTLCLYLYNRLLTREFYEKYMQITVDIQTSGEFNEVPADFLEQFYHVFSNTLLTVMVLIVLFHLIMYACFYFDKKVGRMYVTFLSFVGCFGAILSGLLLISSSPWSIPYLLLGVGFFFVAYGLKLFTPEVVARSQE